MIRNIQVCPKQIWETHNSVRLKTLFQSLNVTQSRTSSTERCGWKMWIYPAGVPGGRLEYFVAMRTDPRGGNKPRGVRARRGRLPGVQSLWITLRSLWHSGLAAAGGIGACGTVAGGAEGAVPCSGAAAAGRAAPTLPAAGAAPSLWLLSVPAQPLPFSPKRAAKPRASRWTGQDRIPWAQGVLAAGTAWKNVECG